MSEELLGLVEACKKDDKKARESFSTECGKIIRGILWKPCRGKREEIHEITQRVWVKLLKGGLTAFRGTSQYQFLAYLKTITINETRAYFGSIQQKGDDDETVTARPTSPGWLDDDGQPDADLEGKMDLERKKKRLRECIKGLTAKQQEIVWMKAKEYKDAEIGRILGLSLGTVAGTYAKLKAKLRECMERAEK